MIPCIHISYRSYMLTQAVITRVKKNEEENEQERKQDTIRIKPDTH
jgi:hypothetical protein